jgi:hypothetical protein
MKKGELGGNESNDKVLIVLNNSSQRKKIDLNPYRKIIGDNFNLINLETNKEVEIFTKIIEISSKSGNIFLIK